MPNNDRIDPVDPAESQSGSGRKEDEKWLPRAPDFEVIFNSFSMNPNAPMPDLATIPHDNDKEVFMAKQRCLKLSLHHSDKVHSQMIKDNLDFFDNSLCFDNRSSILEAVAKATKKKADGGGSDESAVDELVDKNGLKNVLFCNYGCSTSGLFDVIILLTSKKESQVNNISLISKNDLESKFITLN